MLEIVFKNKNAVVVYKPAGIPSQPDKSGDKDAMTLTSEALLAQGEREELYLIHRLDRVVGGLMVFAKNRKAASELSALVSGVGIGKEYLAVVEGIADGGEMRDYLYKDSILGKAFVADKKRTGAKAARLEYTVLETVMTAEGERSLVRIKLDTGRFHQIRAQFSSRSLPLVGDRKYGSKDASAHMPALFAYRLNINSESVKIDERRLPDISLYPWNLFTLEKYNL